jgi:hypothetical protein
MKAILANNGCDALNFFNEGEDKRSPFKAILLNTHLLAPTGFEVAKRIHISKPDQRLILMTTTPIEDLSKDCLQTAGIEYNEILLIPFKLSKLVEAVFN